MNGLGAVQNKVGIIFKDKMFKSRFIRREVFRKIWFVDRQRLNFNIVNTNPFMKDSRSAKLWERLCLLHVGPKHKMHTDECVRHMI